MNFTFSEDMIETALICNGWHSLWSEDNWVHGSGNNPEWSGVSKKRAFEILLVKLNLIPKNVDKCWSETR